MRLQTFCIDEQAAECYKPDIPEGVVAEHKVTDTNQHGGGCSNVRCKVCDAICEQLTSHGQDRPSRK